MLSNLFHLSSSSSSFHLHLLPVLLLFIVYLSFALSYTSCFLTFLLPCASLISLISSSSTILLCLFSFIFSSSQVSSYFLFRLVLTFHLHTFLFLVYIFFYFKSLSDMYIFFILRCHYIKLSKFFSQIFEVIRVFLEQILKL